MLTHTPKTLLGAFKKLLLALPLAVAIAGSAPAAHADDHHGFYEEHGYYRHHGPDRRENYRRNRYDRYHEDRYRYDDHDGYRGRRHYRHHDDDRVHVNIGL